MTEAPRVLVMDGVGDTCQVLEAVFRPRGTQVHRIRQSDLPGRFLADLVVIDTEADPAVPADTLPEAPRIVIGRLKSPVYREGDRLIAKPYQVRELIGAIEEVLACRAA